MTQQEMYTVKFKEKFKALHPTLVCLSDYVDRFTEIEMKCTICNSIFSNTPKNVTGNGRKTGCLVCGEVGRITNIRNSAKSKLKEQERRIKDSLKGSTTQWVRRIDSNNIELKCTKCKSVWIGHRHMIRKYKQGGCKPCSVKAVTQIKWEENILPRINSRKPSETFTLIEGTKLLAGECSICNSNWTVSRATARKSTGCPACARNTALKYNRRLKKEVKVRGKVFTCEGYEHFVIRHLLSKGVKAKDISTSPPLFKYVHNKKSLRYIPDMEVEGTIVEVKSPFTFGLYGKMFGRNVLTKMKAKARAVVKAGAEFEVYIVHVDYKKGPVVIKMPNNWFTFSNSTIRERTLDHLNNIIIS